MMADTDIVLRAEALSMSFGKLEVTRAVSIALPRGARYALIGPNGRQDHADQPADRPTTA